MNARNESFAPGMDEDREVAQLRVPPHSMEAETAILGALLLDNGAWDRIADILVEADFYRYENRLIFAAIGALINSTRPADVITVFTHLESGGKDVEAGGLPYLHSLAQHVPSVGNLRRYAEVVRERSVLRKLIGASDEIATSAFNTGGRTVADILDAAEGMVMAIGEKQAAAGEDWVGTATSMVELLDRIQVQADDDAPEDHTETGLVELDRLLNGGVRPGQLFIIGGRPSMGKTALAVAIGQHIALNEGGAVGMFSMEMTRRELSERQIAMVSKIHLTRVQRPKFLKDMDWPELSNGVETLRKADFDVIDKGGLNINQVRSKARLLKRRHGRRLKLVIVDYLQLMAGTDSRAPRTYQIEEASRGLKTLAKELEVCVIALVQVNRGVEKEIDQMPRLSDIKDCGAIEQDADIVVFVHRPYKAKPNLGPEWEFIANCSLSKQRNGPTGTFDLQYVGKHVQFSNWPDGSEKPSSPVVTTRKAL